MTNSTSRQSSRIKDGSQKDRQPPIRVDGSEQGRSSPRQHDDQKGRRQQSEAELNNGRPRDSSGEQHPRQSDDYEQSRQQGRNLPEGNQQDGSREPRQQQ